MSRQNPKIVDNTEEFHPILDETVVKAITRGALVPFHLLAYYKYATGFTPEICEGCLAYFEGSRAFIVGYPIDGRGVESEDARLFSLTGEDEVAACIDVIGKRNNIKHITVLSPERPKNAPEWTISIPSNYWELDLSAPLPQNKPKRKLFASVALASVVGKERWGKDHDELLARYLSSMRIKVDNQSIYSRMEQYLASCPEAMLFSVRTNYGQLQACAVADYSALNTSFYMFSIISGKAQPTIFNLLMAAMSEEAAKRGHTRINLGLGNEQSMYMLRKYWKAKPAIPYTESSWFLDGPHVLPDSVRDKFYKPTLGDKVKKIFGR